jgi:SAM-dependent methyltransferase
MEQTARLLETNSGYVGVREAHAFDQAGFDARRAAEALGDLICACILEPERWRWRGTKEEDILNRARQFDWRRLLAGSLDDAVPPSVRHARGEVVRLPYADGSMDLMSSRAVLEHFLEFDEAAKRLFAVTKRGGIAVHHVDLVDHRAYVDPKFHWWSFLAEDEDWSDGVVNRLRWCEMRVALERAGFEVLEAMPRRGRMPAGFVNQIRGRFREMSEEELSMTGVICVIRRA